MTTRPTTTYPGHKERGATVVEFAVIAALLLVILFGILEYALIFLQAHYVTNAAREGARIGVRANTYDCYNGIKLPDYADDTGVCISNRTDIVKQEVADYLDILYDWDTIYNNTTLVTSDADGDDTTKDDYVLTVSVKATNPFTNITPRLLQTLVSSSDTSHPGEFRYSAILELEDQDEYDPDNP